MAQLGVTLYLPAMPDIVEALSMSEAEGYNALLMYLGGAVAPIVLAAYIIRIVGRSVVLLGVALLFGTLASLAIPFGMHIVALLALGLSALGTVMMILLSIKRIL